MSEHTCAVADCGRPVQDATICTTCTSTLERDLGDVPAHRSELEVTLTRQAVVGERNGGKSAEVPLAYHTGASEALAVLRSALHGWVRVAVEEDDAAWPSEDSLDALARFLQRRLPWLRRHPAADEAVDEITSAIDLARRTVDRPTPRLYAGPCKEQVDGQECDGELYARPNATEVVCPKCSAVHDVSKRRDWLRESVSDHLGTAAEISALCRHILGELVTTAMIRGYAHRGTLEARGETRDPRGRIVSLYRLDDVFTAAAKAGSSPQSRRDARKAAREAEEMSDPPGTHDTRVGAA